MSDEPSVSAYDLAIAAVNESPATIEEEARRQREEQAKAKFHKWFNQQVAIVTRAMAKGPLLRWFPEEVWNLLDASPLVFNQQDMQAAPLGVVQSADEKVTLLIDEAGYVYWPSVRTGGWPTGYDKDNFETTTIWEAEQMMVIGEIGRKLLEEGGTE